MRWTIVHLATLLPLAAGTVELAPVTVLSPKTGGLAGTTPGSVGVMEKTRLESSGAADLTGLSARIPGTRVSSLGNRTETFITMRGVSNYATFESSVPLYVDDAPVPFNYGYQALDLFTVERVETLRGPQGTLFGKNAEAGVINVYTTPPAGRTEGEVSAGAGSYGYREGTVRVSGPTPVENLRAMVSLRKSGREGYINQASIKPNYAARSSSAA